MYVLKVMLTGKYLRRNKTNDRYTTTSKFRRATLFHTVDPVPEEVETAACVYTRGQLAQVNIETNITM